MIFAALPCYANNLTVDVLVNGQLVVSDAPSFLDTDTNRTFVPVRFISQALGASVDWVAANVQAIITWSGSRILLPINSSEAVIQRADNMSSTVTMDAPARIIGDRTMVPLRFVSEVLGAKVVWVPLSGVAPGRVEITYVVNPPVKKENIVKINNLEFLPAVITISKGETVTWINQDNIPHTATGGGFDSGYMGPGATFKLTFNNTGTFDYICTYHPYMNGSVVVK
jgi:plastocyanin